jgi:hypothetical protein
MKCPILSAIASALLLTCGAAAQPWTPSGCGGRFDKNWKAFAQAMREAKPGSPIYTPKPFPKKDAEVIEDFRYAYSQMWKRTRWTDLPQEERALYKAVQNDTLGFRVERVENWTPTNCLAEHQKDFFFLLYVTDTASGGEVGRFVVNQSGLASGWAVPPAEKDPRAAAFKAARAPRLPEAVARIKAQFGIQGTRAQYVATYGTLECPIVAPCVALQSGKATYLLKGIDLFELGPVSPRHSLDEMNDPARRAQVKQSLTAREALVSLGAERWAVVTKVPQLR